jgi:hypothetical protein
LNNRSKVAVVLIVAAFALWPAAASAQEKLEKLYVGVAGLSGALAHAFIAQDSGLYAKHGLYRRLDLFSGRLSGDPISAGRRCSVGRDRRPEVIAARVAGSDATMIAVT